MAIMEKPITRESRMHDLVVKHWDIVSKVRDETGYAIPDADSLNITANRLNKNKAGDLIKATDEELEELKKVPEERYEGLLKATAKAYQSRVNEYEKRFREGDLTLEEKNMLLEESHTYSMYALEIWRVFERH